MRFAVIAIGVTALAGCAVDVSTSRPEVTLPDRYAIASAAAAAMTDGKSNDASANVTLAADWWKLFGDPTLDVLVDAVLKGNADVRLAVSRVDETAAVLGLARAAQWPGLDLGASVTRARSSTLNGAPVAPGGPDSTTHRLVLQTAFEIDLWGRLRHATAAARQQLLAAQYARDAVQLALVGSTVQAYFGVRALDAQLTVNEAQLVSRRESLDIARKRLGAGAASTLEVAQAQTALAAVAAQRPELQRQRALLAHQLGQLTGKPGLVLASDSVALPQPPAVPADLPSSLLERRPDVRQAEAAYSAAQSQVEVARAARWPTLSLTGLLGVQSADLSDLLKSGARIFSIGPSMVAPLFDAGRYAARTDQARAQAEQASIGYERAAQVAFREVADALAGADSSARQEIEFGHQRAAATEALRIAQKRYDAGYSGYLELLDAQRSLQDAELAQVRSRQARLDASIVLIKALGGGWVATAVR
jgi:multidrug efflux system outer membrane protein